MPNLAHPFRILRRAYRLAQQTHALSPTASLTVRDYFPEAVEVLLKEGEHDWRSLAKPRDDAKPSIETLREGNGPRIADDLREGEHVLIYGPAKCGKSRAGQALAMQVADKRNPHGGLVLYVAPSASMDYLRRAFAEHGKRDGWTILLAKTPEEMINAVRNNGLYGHNLRLVVIDMEGRAEIADKFRTLCPTIECALAVVDPPFDVPGPSTAKVALERSERTDRARHVLCRWLAEVTGENGRRIAAAAWHAESIDEPLPGFLGGWKKGEIPIIHTSGVGGRVTDPSMEGKTVRYGIQFADAGGSVAVNVTIAGDDLDGIMDGPEMMPNDGERVGPSTKKGGAWVFDLPTVKDEPLVDTRDDPGQIGPECFGGSDFE